MKLILLSFLVIFIIGFSPLQTEAQIDGIKIGHALIILKKETDKDNDKKYSYQIGWGKKKFYNLARSKDKRPIWKVGDKLAVIPYHMEAEIWKYRKLSKMLFEIFNGDTTNLRSKILGMQITEFENDPKDSMPVKELKGIW